MGEFFGLPILDFWLPPIIAFAAVLLCVPVARELGIALGLTDKPGGRKNHDEEVPLVGGLVIFPVFMICGMFAGFDIVAYLPLYLGLTMILITGALDDRFHISAWVRFFIQFLAAGLIVIVGDARLYHLGNLFGFGNLGLDFMSIPFSIIAVVLFVNAINLMDGLDGLAAGKSAVVLGWLMLACAFAGQWPPFFAMAVLMGCILGFLFYNMRHPLRSRASIFLGDAGSLSLGLVLAWYCIGLAREPDPVVVPITIAWIIALPVIDACGQFYRRVKEGRHPFDADRGHFHHHFVHAGIPVGRSTVLILAWGVALGAIGYFGIHYGLPQYVLTIGWIILLFSHMALSYKPQRFIRLLSRLGVEPKDLDLNQNTKN
ncbi:MAG: MraY family glycosyltransferase [Alphaproteobacteria bacterium]